MRVPLLFAFQKATAIEGGYGLAYASHKTGTRVAETPNISLWVLALSPFTSYHLVTPLTSRRL